MVELTGVSRGGLLEKDITLEVAKILKKMLENKGCDVKMTRETDTDVSHLIPGGPETRYRRDVHSRTKFVNESNGDLYVSIHVDSCDDPSIRGAIVFHSKNNEESLNLATIIQSHLNKVTVINPQAGEYFHQEVKEGDFHILNNAVIPGVLAEVDLSPTPTTENYWQPTVIERNWRKRFVMELLTSFAIYPPINAIVSKPNRRCFNSQYYPENLPAQ